jgi:hypothetical protein
VIYILRFDPKVGKYNGGSETRASIAGVRLWINLYKRDEFEGEHCDSVSTSGVVRINRCIPTQVHLQPSGLRGEFPNAAAS